MWVQAFLLLVSLATLYYGAELALGSAEKIGRYFRLSPLVIGLVIVGFGTSLPELFVSQLAAARGRGDIALGNIIGSNVANLFLILGISGVIAPLVLKTKEILKQLIMHLVVTLILIAVMTQATLTPISSITLLMFFALFVYMTIFKKSPEEIEKQLNIEEREQIGMQAWVKLITGFALLYGGGELLVSSGSNLGELAGISPFVISAIFVAFGTSFPELVTSLIAVKEGKDLDLVIGNILGSNVFNVSLVMGSLGLYDVDTSASYAVELWSLLGAALFLLLLYWRGFRFYRFTGGLFLLCYVGLIAHWVTI